MNTYFTTIIRNTIYEQNYQLVLYFFEVSTPVRTVGLMTRQVPFDDLMDSRKYRHQHRHHAFEGRPQDWSVGCLDPVCSPPHHFVSFWLDSWCFVFSFLAWQKFRGLSNFFPGQFVVFRFFPSMGCCGNLDSLHFVSTFLLCSFPFVASLLTKIKRTLILSTLSSLHELSHSCIVQ